MNKIAAQVALSAALVALCSSASAQQPKKIPRIGYLASSDAATASATTEGIRLALREAGYIEGQNIAIEYAGGITWIRDAKNATKTIPIVMVGAGNDPVQAGLESLARPGGNVTGLTNLSGQLGVKQRSYSKKPFRKFVESVFSTRPPLRRM